ncbi:G-protein coupled receptor Mth2 isoform X2 [Rhodnius prolixus]|uniref:G-protein coupled receptor Mth2 isoform X2 n=1 Tax=Rhodnius prolixus TaxID=13249 RepID=UPI003D189892
MSRVIVLFCILFANQVVRLLGAPIDYDDNDNTTILPKIPKCCLMNQSLLDPSEGCSNSSLEFVPSFAEEQPEEVDIVIGLKCAYGRYRLEPEKASEDEFHLLADGSLSVPFQEPSRLTFLEYCLENTMVDDEAQIMPFLCFSPSIEQPHTKWKEISHIIFPIGSLTSVPFLIVVVILYLGVKELRTTHGKVLASYSACLAFAYFSLSMVQLFGDQMIYELCVSMAFAIQFSFMACFFWLNLLCLHTWRQLRKGYSLRGGEVNRVDAIFLLYSLYGWGLPILIISVSVIMDLSPTIPSTYLKPNFGLDSCWFHSDNAAIPYFYGPVAVLLFFNVIFFILTTRILCRTDTTTDERITSMDQAVLGVIVRKRKQSFLQAVLLFLAMGLNWLLEVFSWFTGGPPQLWLITDIINTLQGVVVFYIFVIREPWVRRLAVQYFYRICCLSRGVDNTRTNHVQEEELRPMNEINGKKFKQAVNRIEKLGNN